MPRQSEARRANGALRAERPSPRRQATYSGCSSMNSHQDRHQHRRRDLARREVSGETSLHTSMTIPSARMNITLSSGVLRGSRGRAARTARPPATAPTPRGHGSWSKMSPRIAGSAERLQRPPLDLGAVRLADSAPSWMRAVGVELRLVGSSRRRPLSSALAHAPGSRFTMPKSRNTSCLRACRTRCRDAGRRGTSRR